MSSVQGRRQSRRQSASLASVAAAKACSGNQDGYRKAFLEPLKVLSSSLKEKKMFVRGQHYFLIKNSVSVFEVK